MNSCPSGKRIYQTPELAEEALIGAWIAYDYGKGKGPVAIYQCDLCGLYHFTSKGEMNKRLDQMIKEGKIQKQKEADKWERKFRKR